MALFALGNNKDNTMGIGKMGILHPIHRRDNVINIPGNFRGITIVLIISKIHDIIRNTHQRMAMPEDRLDTQFGFNPGRAPAYATLLLNEAIAEAKTKSSPMCCQFRHPESV